MTEQKDKFNVARVAAATIERKAGELRRTAELIEEMVERGSFPTALAAADLAQVLVDEIGKAQEVLYKAVVALKSKHGGDV